MCNILLELIDTVVVRVGFVYSSLEGSGSLRNYLDSVVKKLQSLTDVTPVIIFNKGDEKYAPNGVELIKTKHTFLSQWHKVVKQNDIDIIHLNTTPLIGQFSALLASCPIVATIHGNLHWAEIPQHVQKEIEIRSTVWRMRDRFSRISIDRFLAVSPYVARTLTKKVGVSPEKIKIVYEGISDRYFDRAKMTKPVDLTSKYILHVSRASAKKNVKSAIKAFAKLKNRTGKDVNFIIAGKGWRKRVSSVAESHNVANSVQFLGFVSEERLLTLYDNADAFVFPSYHETFGLPNIEAMSRRTPVVTSTCPGIRSVLDEEAALFIDPDDISSLARAIEQVLTNEPLRNELIKNGLQNTERYHWKSHVLNIVKIYKDLLGDDTQI